MRFFDGISIKSSGRKPQSKELARETDEYGDVIVSDYKHYRILRFDELNEQSKMSLHYPSMPIHHYIKAMLMAVAWQDAGPALLLGLGGGSLLRALYAYNNRVILDVVELRPLVVALAQHYFTLPQAEQITYYLENATDYLRRDNKPGYAFIFSDLYLAYFMDPLQGARNFLTLCKASLREDGWLVLNYQQAPRSNSALYCALYQLFTDVFCCRTDSGNVVIFATSVPCQLKILQTQALQLPGDIFGEMGQLARRLTRLV